jgi:hypothetical protein
MLTDQHLIMVLKHSIRCPVQAKNGDPGLNIQILQTQMEKIVGQGVGM